MDKELQQKNTELKKAKMMSICIFIYAGSFKNNENKNSKMNRMMKTLKLRAHKEESSRVKVLQYYMN